MLDVRALRECPEEARRRLDVRGDPEVLERLEDVLRLDRERRALLGRVEELRALRNERSEEIGALRRAGREATELIESMREVKGEIETLDARLEEVESTLRSVLLRIPNLPDQRVPPGKEDAFRIEKVCGEPPIKDFEPLPHWELGSRLGVLDLERGAKVTGSGFPLLAGRGARLQRALAAFMLDMHGREHGYREVAPPYMVNRESMIGTGHLPKFERDAYRTDPDDLFLVPTAEVPLTNLHRDEILDGASLPVKYVAHTPCFRREAGSAGRETRGMLRVHQFDKVELVRLERPDRSERALEELTAHAERVLEELGLPYRRILLAGSDLGFGNAITYDLEVWAAGVGEWLEVSSCSCYTDYQARRANIRFRPEPGRGPEFVHTLNGSGVALARIIVALLENGQEPDGGVRLPPVLAPYMGGERIEAP